MQPSALRATDQESSPPKTSVSPETALYRGWESCIVVASGPSLTDEQASRCVGDHVVAVNDAWRKVPFADVLYACDERFWDVKGCEGFQGERWSSHGSSLRQQDDKIECAKRHGLKLVQGRDGEGFCTEPGVIYYGSNSGFQAVNLAIHFGAKLIRLVGFDMQPNGHFFGRQIPQFPVPGDSEFRTFRRAFERAAERMPEGVRIINCTPGSALTCFPMGAL